MPVVPTPQRRVQPAGLPAPRLTSNVPQAAIGVPSGGLDLSAVRDQAIRIGQEEKQKANQIQLTDAGGKLTSRKTQIGVKMVSQKGQNAFTAVDTAREEFNQAAKEIEDGLGSDELKAAYRRMAASAWNELENQGQYHVAAQREEYDRDSTAAFIKAQQTDARANAENPAVVEGNINAMKIAIFYRGKRQGASPEEIKGAQDVVVSSTRFSVLESMVNAGNDLQAEAYFKEHKKDFVGQDLEQADRVTQEGSILGKSQREATAIIARTKSEPEALAEAAKIDHPRVQEKTMALIRQHYNDIASAKRDAQEAAFNQAVDAVIKTHNVDKIPRTIWNQLSGADKLRLEADAERRRNPPARPSDPAIYNEVANLAGLYEQAFLTADLNQPRYVNGLSRVAREHFQNLQISMRVRERGESETELKRELARAQGNVEQYREKIQAAEFEGDDEKATFWKQQKVEAEGEAARATAALRAMRQLQPPPLGASGGLPNAPLTVPTTRPPGPTFTPVPDSVMRRLGEDQRDVDAPPAAPAPTARSRAIPPAPDVALTRPSRSMLEDILHYGPAYGDTLRVHGVMLPSSFQIMDWAARELAKLKRGEALTKALQEANQAALSELGLPKEPPKEKKPKKPKSVSIIRDDSGRAIRLVPE